MNNFKSHKSYNSPILEYSMKIIPETRHSD